MTDLIFKEGRLNLNLKNKKERSAAMWLTFNPMNKDYEMYNEALGVFPKIKGLGRKRKAKIVFDIINIFEKHNKKS